MGISISSGSGSGSKIISSNSTSKASVPIISIRVSPRKNGIRIVLLAAPFVISTYSVSNPSTITKKMSSCSSNFASKRSLGKEISKSPSSVESISTINSIKSGSSRMFETVPPTTSYSTW